MNDSVGELQLVNESTAREEAETVVHLAPARIGRAKAAFAVRRVPRAAMRTLVGGNAGLAPGDLVLARVDRVRQHTRLELSDGRRAHLHPGDEIVVSLGHRYAPDQFHAVAPDRLGPCALVAAGGIAARAISRHGSVKPPTEITLLGRIGGAGAQVLNLRQFALAPEDNPARPGLVIAVAGTSMNAGKTTVNAHLVRGLTGAGLRVGAAKITGTGAGGDLWRMLDAGAEIAVDFTDAGHASTYCLGPAQVGQVFDLLIDHLGAAGMDVAVLELADGILQLETARLLSARRFSERVDRLLFAAGDSMGAVAGCARLREMGLPLRLVSGALTRSPLAMQEASAGLDVPVMAAPRLAEPEVALAAVGLSPEPEQTCIASSSAA